MKLSDIKTLKEIESQYNIPIKTLYSRLKHLKEYEEYKRLGKGQAVIVSPVGIQKITKRED